MADKEFEPHMMYKGEEAIKANTHEKHLELKEDGYNHDSPAPFKMSGFPEHATAAPLKRCWEGYKPNPDGRPAKEQGSCVEK
tara:strand:+ start:312 stop:557 length:246 start_codon:yes stop_codon:yes gene_type:complete